MTGPQSKRAAPGSSRDSSKSMQTPRSATLGGYLAGDAQASAELMAMARDVITKHGLSAFEMLKFDAAIHEAGHAVLFLFEGRPVLSLAIYARRPFGGRQQWGGEATSGLPWFADKKSDPASDLRRVRFLLAGIIAERIHHRGKHRAGSSLDEVLMARRLCDLAASKMGSETAELLARQEAIVEFVLKRFWPEALQLAAALEKKQTLVGAKLEALLQPIRKGLL